MIKYIKNKLYVYKNIRRTIILWAKIHLKRPSESNKCNYQVEELYKFRPNPLS